jgi:hypothetical protein
MALSDQLSLMALMLSVTVFQCLLMLITCIFDGTIITMSLINWLLMLSLMLMLMAQLSLMLAKLAHASMLMAADAGS